MYDELIDRPEPNIPLLRKVVEWVEEQAALPMDDRAWDQSFWFNTSAFFTCGTSMCVAGKIATDDGWLPVIPAHGGYVADHCSKDGVVRFYEQVAAELLGINEEQSRTLFHSYNSAEDIRTTAEYIAGERL